MLSVLWTFLLLSPLCLWVEQFVCRSEAVADVVILVDGSWSIGRVNFRLVRMFLENLVDAFDVGIDKTRIGEPQLLSLSNRTHCRITVVIRCILETLLLSTNCVWTVFMQKNKENKNVYVYVPFSGLAQYSGDPRIEWHLNTYHTKDAVIDAIKNMPYKGGNTLTGCENRLYFVLS